jgi:DNA-directed RNA polymerase specialized sigma24 family protein
MAASVRDDRQAVEIGILVERLAVKSPRAALVVNPHYFTGYTLEEVAENSGLSLKQVRSGWEEAKKYLKRALYVNRRSGRQFAESESDLSMGGL